MKITSEDIFLYVYYQDDLDSEKRTYIEKNKTIFRQQIDSLQKRKQLETEGQTMASEKNALDKLHKAQIAMQEINDDVKLEDIPLQRLAAKSIDTKETIAEKTFADPDNEYLIKVLKYSNQTKIFVFAEKILPAEIEIFIEPGEKTFVFNSQEQPYIIKEKIEIKSVKLLIP